MRDARATLLRAPPFPGARPLAMPRRRTVPRATDDVQALAAAVSAQRVGGDFWSAADPWKVLADGGTVVGDAADDVALLAAAAGKDVIDRSGRIVPRATLLHALAADVAAYDYADPFTGAGIAVAEWIALLGLWRRQLDANRAVATIHGIAWWKRAAIRRFLWCGAPATGKAAAIWPSRVPPVLPARLAAAGRPMIRLEDGFLRSAGLGTHLHQPCSIVADARGIHFDPRAPSDLEHILAHTDFDDALRDRAARLTRRIVAAGLTKYAAATDTTRLPAAPRRVLVAGQVEDDASVALGGAGVAGNLDLLRRARAAEPDALLIYKPHPDVVAGLRRGHVPTREALRHADLILPHAPLPALLAQMDAVHVLTSLTGFEALLRGCEVVVHGQPFYAGWGLTRDLAPPVVRRGRALALEELVAGALILYPRYLDPVTRLPCPPEVLVERLAARPRPARGPVQYWRLVQGGLARGTRALAGA